MNKKGSIQDLVHIALVMVVLGVTVLIGFKIWGSFSSGFAEVEDNARALQSNSEISSMYTGTIDNIALLLLIGLSVVSLVLASMVRVHPVFFVFYLLILVLIIFISGIMSNIYLEIANMPEFIAEAEQLTFITHILGGLPFIIGVLGFLIAIIMYKNYTQQ